MYVEHDVDAADSSSADRQPTAFSMLKALLNRKFQSKEIPAVMEKVFQLSIKSTLEGVRNSCRQLALQYLLNYPIGKKIKGKSKKTAVKLTGLLLCLRKCYMSCPLLASPIVKFVSAELSFELPSHLTSAQVTCNSSSVNWNSTGTTTAVLRRWKCFNLSSSLSLKRLWTFTPRA